MNGETPCQHIPDNGKPTRCTNCGQRIKYSGDLTDSSKRSVWELDSDRPAMTEQVAVMAGVATQASNPQLVAFEVRHTEGTDVILCDEMQAFDECVMFVENNKIVAAFGKGSFISAIRKNP